MAKRSKNQESQNQQSRNQKSGNRQTRNQQAARKPRQKWAMYPKEHPQVSHLLSLSGLHFTFHADDDDGDEAIEEYDTRIQGRFNCTNRACSAKGWSSKQIAITIRMYSNNEYNARVYYQSCQLCHRASRPLLDVNSYVERVSYRLKKWSGIQLTPPPYVEKKKQGPHLSQYCEGCKAGHCSQLDDVYLWQSF